MSEQNTEGHSGGRPQDRMANYLDDLLQGFRASVAYTPDLSPREEITPVNTRRPDEEVAAFVGSSIEGVLDEVIRHGGWANVTCGQLDVLWKPINARLEGMRLTTRAALSDPGQASTMLETLQSLAAGNMPHRAAAELSVRLLDDLLYGDNSNMLLPLVSQSDAEISGKAQDLLISTYGRSAYQTPELTAYILANYTALLRRNLLLEATPDLNLSASRDSRDGTMAILARAIAHASREDILAVVRSLEAGGDLGGYEAEEVRSFGRTLIEYLERADAYHDVLLESLGMDAEQTSLAWKSGKSGNNLGMLLALEAETPGIGRALSTVLGVYNFGRYTPKLLLQAYQALHNPPDLYVLVATARKDPGGTFSQGRSLHWMNEDLQADGSNSRVIPVELDDVSDIPQIARRLRKCGFGPAEHAVLRAHGQPGGVELGGGTFTMEAAAATSWRSLGALLRTIVKRDGSLVLASCSTGSGDASFAHHIADTSRLRTLAPGEDVGIRNLYVRRDPATGKWLCDIEYYNTTTGKPRPTFVFYPGQAQPLKTFPGGDGP